MPFFDIFEKAAKFELSSAANYGWRFIAVSSLYFSVAIMKDKLDSENLGIITRSSFLEEFYPGETTPEIPKSFILYHYNGLARSCPDNKVSQ